MSRMQDEQAVENFRDYLRIPTVHPDVNYDECVSFLRRQADELGLPIKVVSPNPKKPTVIITWPGLEPELSGILLNSHTDVVPVYPELWDHDPFGAYRDDEGNIFARGAQDMKCVAIQYLEAVRRLKGSGVRLRRNVHMCFVPDEETGSFEGMAKFVNSEEFCNMNVGFALDEGFADPADIFILFYAERSVWQIEVHCPGTTGHGSLLPDNTAAGKVRVLLDRAMDFREKEKRRLENNPHLTIGDVTSLNVNMLKGGVQNNVIPPEMSVVMDIRIAPTVDHAEFESMLEEWCKEAGPGTYIEFLQRGIKESVTALDSSNPWWTAFKSVADKLKLNIKPVVSPAAADARFIRRMGIPALGFSPLNNTPQTLHSNNEFINDKIFLRGIDIYCQIIEALGNVPE
ncbi:aminoacylase-1 [Anabrus simplex]|uniref:aminoacylase-1 n=1 Tax=Anabrus simplex TaxID=316456 RepID=UPI0035A3836F